ncbi:TldD/PmbA family protein [Myxosarcina sp. GI1]|uniref:TldD/PmbA family protein n=1 Tax=Myxosarcina sp. GI1 TaxID=1541065 RepID=UPI00056C8609|nr:TldD/PmbA family protein [Myxosarcina sp. GI1]
MSSIEQLLKIAINANVTHAEIYQIRGQSRQIFFEGNRLKQLESSQSEGTALRVWSNDRQGLAVASGFIEPETLVAKAIALSQLNPIETPVLTPGRTEIHAGNTIDISIETLVELGLTAIANLRDEYPELVCSAEFEWERETTTLLNSQGLRCQYSGTSIAYYIGAESIRGEDFLGIYDGEYSKQPLELDSVVQRILQRLDWAKNNVTPPVGKMPVLFTANAATMLWETIEDALNGKEVAEGSSPWSDRHQNKVVSELLTLSQQPDKIPYDCPFDDEGTPTQTLEVIVEGVLNRFYCDRATGRELGIDTTGNGFRPDLDSYPTPSLVNLCVEPGKYTWKELVSQLDTGIIIDQILGGGADISGDFSVNVDLGYRVRQGKIVGRVKDTAISGNVYEVLNRIVALGNECTWNGSYYTPALIVEEVSVVG